MNDQNVRSLKPGATPKDVRDSGSSGLVLTILPSGRKQWTLRYRTAGRQRRLILGDYPGLTLARARRAAESARVQVRAGGDPAAERTAAKSAQKDTIEALADDYLKKHARKKKRTAAEDERVLTRYVLPHWRGRSVREITRRDVRAIVEAIAERGSLVMANRTLEIVRKMFNFGIGHDWLEGNPAARIEKPGVEHSRERVLTDDEIRSLWDLLGRFPTTTEKQAPGRQRAKSRDEQPLCPISPTLAAVQQLRLWTAQRGGEIVNMRWQDVDVETGWWTIPAASTKNGRPHRVPLTPEAVKIVKAQTTKGSDTDERPTHVFAGRGASPPVHRIRKAGAALSRVLKFEFRGHDLRRTAATRMAAAGVPREHISRVLNHIEGGPSSTRTYDRYDYDAEKRTALEIWARELTRILENRVKAGADVVSIHQGRA